MKYLILFVISQLFSCAILPNPNYSQTTKQKINIIIDAGHGGKDDGCIYKGYKEKDITLSIAKQIKMLADTSIYNVIMTRDSDVFMNPIQRVSFSVINYGSIFVSIHVNELKGWGNISGIQVYKSDMNPYPIESNRLADSIISSITFKESHIPQQRKKNIFVLSSNLMPSVLIETGFITNKGDLNFLTDSTKTKILASEVLEGINKFYKNGTK